MFVPNERIASRSEDEAQAPEIGLFDYLGQKFMQGFADTTPAMSYMGLEAQRAEIEQYPQAKEDIVNASIASAETMGAMTEEDFRMRSANLPRLTEEQWKSSQYWRKGMRYEPDITEARLRVYSEWYDAKAKREDKIARRAAGFFDGTAGFLASIAGSIPDPINLVAFGYGVESTAAKRIAIAAAENMTAEGILQLSTSSQREAAGIALSTDEKMLNIAFAGIIGASFRGFGDAISKRMAESGTRKIEREAVLLRGEDGKMVPAVVDAEPSVKVFTETALTQMPIADKVRILSKLSDSLDKVGDTGRLQRVVPGELGDTTAPDFSLSRMEKVMNDVFANDREAGDAITKAVGYDGVDIGGTVVTNKPMDSPVISEPVSESAARINDLTDYERMGVGDESNIDLTSESIPETDYPLLQGKTLFELADKEMDDFESGISKAVELINTDGCK